MIYFLCIAAGFLIGAMFMLAFWCLSLVGVELGEL